MKAASRGHALTTEERQTLKDKYGKFFRKHKARLAKRGAFTSRAYDNVKAVDPALGKPAYAFAAEVWDKENKV